MKGWKLWGSIIVCVLIILSTIGANSIYTTYKNMLESISVNESDGEQGLEDAEDKKSLEPFAMLTYGVSTRKQFNDTGHSDTMLLALVDPMKVKISLISIPRDAYVNIPGHGMNKINTAYPIGESKLMMETIENWLDIDIHAYTSINFQGFIDLVDLIGGIDVYVPRKMEYDDRIDGTRVRLAKGQQVLDGKNALDFVRFRKSNDGRHDSDYTRMERQQQALTAISSKMTSLRSIPRVFNMMNILSDNVQTSLTPKELEQLTKIFLSFRTEDLETHSIIGGGHNINGVWYEVVTEEEVQRINDIIYEFFNGGDLEI